MTQRALHHEKSWFETTEKRMLEVSFVLFSKARALRRHAVLKRDEGETMRPTSKMSGEAHEEDVAVVSASSSHLEHRKRRRKVAVGVSLEAKRDVLEQFIPEYREALDAQKRVVLDDFTRLTGYHRTYAIWLFNHHSSEHQTPVHTHQRDYGAEVEEVLVQVWKAANRLCSKLLIPSLPMFLDALEQHDHLLHLTPKCRSQLLSTSTATAGRLLYPHRQQEMRGLCTTRAGTLFKSHIPIRTFEQRDE